MIIRDDSNLLLAPGLIGPYNEDSILTLTCEVNEPGEPATTQVSWWQLQSVSALPFGIAGGNSEGSSANYNGGTRNNLQQQQANRSHWLSRALSFAFDDNNKVAEYLTTITLEQTIGAATPSHEYFVALHNNSIGHSNEQNSQLVLPFAEGHSLKRWIKVQTGNAGGGSGENSLAQVVNGVNTDTKPQSSLQLNLARSNLGDEYLCLANNNDLSAPLNSSIKINMNRKYHFSCQTALKYSSYLKSDQAIHLPLKKYHHHHYRYKNTLNMVVILSVKPTEVKIVNKQNYAFKLNQKLVVECKVYGSKPSPRIRWFKGTKEVESVSASGLSDELMVAQNYISEIDRDTSNSSTNDTSANSTKVSYLTLIPKLSDNQQSLTCSAHNPSIPNNLPISDSIIMNVQCK